MIESSRQFITANRRRDRSPSPAHGSGEGGTTRAHTGNGAAAAVPFLFEPGHEGVCVVEPFDEGAVVREEHEPPRGSSTHSPHTTHAHSVLSLVQARPTRVVFPSAGFPARRPPLWAHEAWPSPCLTFFLFFSALN